MFVHRRREFDPDGRTETPPGVALNRRRWMRAAGWTVGAGLAAAAGTWGWRAWRGADADVVGRGQVVPPGNARRPFPFPRDDRFEYGRAETDRAEAARYTNFYEFTSTKMAWRYVDDFRPENWTLRVEGLCRKPADFDIDRFHTTFAARLCERQYRHRCVERWAMAIPWSGVALRHVLESVDPLPQATHVRFVSFLRPDEARNQAVDDGFPWPYEEGLTLPEAMADLTMLATGMYGEPLLKQHGAPIRLVVPWKYGFKSIKSIVAIELVDYEPATFWSTLNPAAYPFQSNVEPDVPRPWPQTHETMLGTGELFATALYNGYAEHVAHLYPG